MNSNNKRSLWTIFLILFMGCIIGSALSQLKVWPLEELGYVPDQFDFICADENGKVMYGSRRVWLMQKDMEWAGDTDIEVEVMTLEELYKDLGDRILDKDAMPTVNADGTITPPKQTMCMPPNKDLSVLVDEHEIILI